MVVEKRVLDVRMIAVILGERAPELPERVSDGVDRSAWKPADYQAERDAYSLEEKAAAKAQSDAYTVVYKKRHKQLSKWRSKLNKLKFTAHGQGNFRYKCHNSNVNGGNRGDCVVRAFGYFDGYFDFHQELKKTKGGVANGVGSNRYEPVADKLGYSYIPVWGAFTKDYLPDKGDYVVFCH